MTAKEMIEKMKEMENKERIEFLDYLHNNHFMQLTDEEKQILSDYYNGHLGVIEDE